MYNRDGSSDPLKQCTIIRTLTPFPIRNSYPDVYFTAVNSLR